MHYVIVTVISFYLYGKLLLYAAPPSGKSILPCLCLFVTDHNMQQSGGVYRPIDLLCAYKAKEISVGQKRL